MSLLNLDFFVMAGNDIKYLNFPIQLLQGFMLDESTCLTNICDYAIYAKSLEFKYGEGDLNKFQNVSNFYGLNFDSIEDNYLNGSLLYDSFVNPPMTGLNVKIFKDFRDNKKSVFEKVSFLAFLALRSILGTKSYCQITNKYWLSRMDGKAKTIQCKSELSQELRKYISEYQTKKMKRELHLNWGLKDYSMHTRGFFVSFKLSMDELVLKVEKRREMYKEKQYRSLQRESLQKARIKLKNFKNN